MTQHVYCETLPNGIQVVLQENHFTQTVAMQCWANVGAAHERESERGLSHFLEHMIFKGTERYGVGEIAGLVESCGGDINAYTSFEHTVFYLTLASQHVFQGIDILHQALFHSTFVEEEFNKEREVILEELRRGKDNPGQIIGQQVFALIYKGCEAGRPIIGFEDQIQKYKRDDLVNFHRRWYGPENLCLVVSGAFDTATMLERIYEGFGLEPKRAAPQKLPIVPVDVEGIQIEVIKGDYQQPRLEIAYRGPSGSTLDSVALDLAAFALSTGEVSRFNQRLRDRDASVIAAGASCYSPGFAGVFEINALMSEDQILSALKGLVRELLLMRGSEGLTESEMDRAVQCLRADRVYRDETVDGRARSLGLGLSTEHNIVHDEVYATMIQHMPRTFVQDALRRWIKPQNVVIVALLPEASVLTDADFRNAYLDAMNIETTNLNIRKKALSHVRDEDPTITTAMVMPGVKLVYRHNPDGELFALTLATEGGLRAEEKPSDFGAFNALSALVGLGSQSVPYDTFVSKVEGMGASVDGFSGKDSLGIQVQCLPDQAETILKLAADTFLHPAFPERQWQSYQQEILQTLVMQEDNPASVGFKLLQQKLYGLHPYGHSVVGDKESISGFTAAGLRQKFVDYRDKGKWVLAAAGPQPAEEVTEQLQRIFDGFNPSSESRAFRSVEDLNTKFSYAHKHMDREQQHIFCGFNGLRWDDPDRPALDVLINILGGHGGRMFVNLRDKEGLAYTVSPVVGYGCERGVIGAYIACSPDKADRAKERLIDEMLSLNTEPPGDGELHRSRNYIIGNHEIGLQKSDAQTMTMALMELYGFGFDDFLSYPKKIETIEAADIKRVANRLLTREAMSVVTVGPRELS